MERVPSVHDGSADESSAYTVSPQRTTVKPRKPLSATAKHHPHIVTKHDYHDHAADPPEIGLSYDNHVTSKGDQSTTAFPFKFFKMLLQIDKEGLSHIVSWQPHGRCFKLHCVDSFKTLLPRFFNQSKISSFQRQLNLYGFLRLTVGRDKGAYYHELFLRNRSDLASCIQRVKVKGTCVRAKSNPKQEPNFYQYPLADYMAAVVAAIPVDSSSGLETATQTPSETMPSRCAILVFMGIIDLGVWN